MHTILILLHLSSFLLLWLGKLGGMVVGCGVRFEELDLKDCAQYVMLIECKD